MLVDLWLGFIIGFVTPWTTKRCIAFYVGTSTVVCFYIHIFSAFCYIQHLTICASRLSLIEIQLSMHIVFVICSVCYVDATFGAEIVYKRANGAESAA